MKKIEFSRDIENKLIIEESEEEYSKKKEQKSVPGSQQSFQKEK